MRLATPALSVPFVLALAATVPSMRDALAQDIDDCMEASPARALSLCRTLVDEGRGNADVWTQLVLSLDKSGRGADARTTLDEALTRYPRDADLLALRDRLATRDTENERLEQAARRNESAVAKGELKLICRTREGIVGIEACRRYLALTDVDGERIRARLAELERALPRVAEAPAQERPTGPTTEPSPPLPSEPSVSPGPSAAPGAESATPDGDDTDTSLARVDPPPVSTPDPETERRRERIASIQRALDALRLPVGAPDGIAGRRTREALARFEALTGRTVTTLDENALTVLEAERARLTAAERMLATSRSAAEDGRVEEALDRLARAESESALLRSPPGYRAELERRLAEEREQERDEEKERKEARELAEEEAASSLEPRSPVPPVSDTPDPRPESDALDGLLTRIGTLERRLADANETRSRDTARLRELVQDTLAAP